MKIAKRIRLFFAVVLFFVCMAAVFLCAGLIKGRTLMHQALSGRRDRVRQETLAVFSLREQMLSGQADTRVNGWLSVVDQEEIALNTKRGKLRARLFAPLAGEEDAPWAIVLHGGLGTDHTRILDIACELSLSGYRVLTPDLYAHGNSEGDIASLGLADAQDVKRWVDWILAEEMNARIVLMGVDEGAAAALLAASDGLQDAVAAVAADSAYLSVRERVLQLMRETEESAGRLDEMLLEAAWRLAFGVPLGDGELTEHVRNLKIPTLFLHGTGDTDVPAWHSEYLADAAGRTAQVFFAEGAGHGMARFLDPQGYYEALLSFFDSALKESS